jgi:hypothetical protein
MFHFKINRTFAPAYKPVDGMAARFPLAPRGANLTTDKLKHI